MSQTSAIEVRNLSVTVQTHFYARPRALLEQLSFDVAPARICAFLGANGAGKTTTLRCILGLLRPNSGSIKLYGRDVRERMARVGLGHLPERPHVPAQLTAYEFVRSHAALAGLPYRAARTAALEALDEVGLAEAQHRRLGSFSKGMLQRAGLAQVIAGQPRLLILDEPLSGLDPRGRAEVRRLIARQRKLGRTVLFSTHVLADVALLCDQVLIIAGGKIIHQGTPQELEAKASGLGSELEVASELLEQSELDALLQHADLHRRLPGSDVFTVGSEEQAMQLVDRLRANKRVLKYIQPMSGGLEQLFVPQAPAERKGAQP